MEKLHGAPNLVQRVAWTGNRIAAYHFTAIINTNTSTQAAPLTVHCTCNWCRGEKPDSVQV